jgi:hypothetical protein
MKTVCAIKFVVGHDKGHPLGGPSPFTRKVSMITAYVFYNKSSNSFDLKHGDQLTAVGRIELAMPFTKIEEVLDKVYEGCNAGSGHEYDWFKNDPKLRSMRAGDVITLLQGEERTSYVVLTSGWRKLEGAITNGGPAIINPEPVLWRDTNTMLNSLISHMRKISKAILVIQILDEFSVHGSPPDEHLLVNKDTVYALVKPLADELDSLVAQEVTPLTPTLLVTMLRQASSLVRKASIEYNMSRLILQESLEDLGKIHSFTNKRYREWKQKTMAPGHVIPGASDGTGSETRATTSVA